MARHLTSRFSQDDWAPLNGGVEALIVEHQHIHPGHRAECWSTLTVAINVSDDLATRRVLAALRTTFASARCTGRVFAGQDGVSRLGAALDEFQVDTVDVVIFPGDGLKRLSGQKLEPLVEAVSHRARGLVVIVGPGADPLFLTGVAGFVEGFPATTHSTGVATFLAMAALSAPSTLTCADHEDVATSFGTSDRPAIVVEAIWLRSAAELVLLSNVCAAVLERADVVSSHFLGAGLGWREVSNISNAIRAKCASDVDMHIQAPVLDLFSP